MTDNQNMVPKHYITVLFPGPLHLFNSVRISDFVIPGFRKCAH
jgi:hypothetical protein